MHPDAFTRIFQVLLVVDGILWNLAFLQEIVEVALDVLRLIGCHNVHGLVQFLSEAVDLLLVAREYDAGRQFRVIQHLDCIFCDFLGGIREDFIERFDIFNFVVVNNVVLQRNRTFFR
ncbi:hypothetical protein NY2A_b317L [Paramecium bursaria Chlorella virus NY2A]|uniref:Uncharacterized protein b317L n=1 Tax=Paramecium bursaria Chlorella virus NY2A TaxID=46021 RepID=A7IWJ2_PBCVN|nr:hypothetical protein NY2A_b317L [Paramecium bursaria Chlorella virus NY2A]YP_001498374.1 hypothetical protein AR158_C293L [Paramecium bursaria Chlorella virus AR158]ABT14716.1 hypothetical protein NY2A_b317L [Paramecium bursaria Chlorella virus NY2A]ABU43838.1 hypothetical protein AR158_C293L [Paramecium bursaria Chlorella virus AR158]